MSKISASRKRHHRLRPGASKPEFDGSYYDTMTRVSGEEHPVDIAVGRRIQHTTERAQIRQLERDVMQRLAESSEQYLTLERLVIGVQREREKVYFDLGYEHGLAERHATSRRGDFLLPEHLGALGKEIRQRIVQQDLPPLETILVLLECAWVVTQRHAT